MSLSILSALLGSIYLFRQGLVLTQEHLMGELQRGTSLRGWWKRFSALVSKGVISWGSTHVSLYLLQKPRLRPLIIAHKEMTVSDAC